MGTRHLTMVIHKEKLKVAQYGQWDGYPSGEGETVLTFLKKTNLDDFKKKLENVRFINEEDEEEIQKFMESIGSPNGWMNSEQSSMYHKKYPYLSRDNGAEILDMIMESEESVLLRDSSDFAGDSLFCEWAYLIDLDNNVLECYEGFNTTPLEDGQRFKNISLHDYSGMNQYYPIKCIKKYPLDKLPTKEEFVNDLEPQEEEEE